MRSLRRSLRSHVLADHVPSHVITLCTSPWPDRSGCRCAVGNNKTDGEFMATEARVQVAPLFSAVLSVVNKSLTLRSLKYSL